MITEYFGDKWSKTCTISAFVLRICTAVILFATLGETTVVQIHD